MASNKKNSKEAQDQQSTTNLSNVGENIDLVGGRNLDVPDFVELALQGFSEGELKHILRLRRRYNENEENELTHEFKRLRFARYLYKEGRINNK